MLRRVAAGTSPCGRRRAGPTGGACPPGSRPAAGGAGGFNAVQKLRTKLSDHMHVGSHAGNQVAGNQAQNHGAHVNTDS
jgi:hypothetical protein